jgi:hypothetical protein
MQGIELSGRDWKDFCDSKEVWAEGTHWDDTLFFVDGVKTEDDASDVADEAVVRVECGYLVDPVAGAPDDLVDCIEWWMAKRNTVSLVVQASAGALDAIRAAVEALGGKVIGGLPK